MDQPVGRLLRALILGILSAGCAVGGVAHAQVYELSELSFQQFERIALDADPLLQGFQARAESARAMAIARSRLPDPRLRLGAVNVPVDSFSLDEEDMTMKEIGFSQALPAYGSLSNREVQFAAMADSEDAMARDRTLEVLRGVRQAWLELHYQFEAVSLVQRSQQVFEELVKISHSRYRAGRGRQQDLIKAQLELSTLEDEVTSMELEKQVMMAELMHWLGAASVSRPAPVPFPALPPLPSLEELRGRLRDHPALNAAQSQVESSRAAVEVARAMYRPETMIDVSYGQRSRDRSDMMTAMVSFNLPLFTSKRQDQELHSSRAELEASKATAEARRRDLLEMLESNYRRWERLNERVAQYDQEIVPFSAQYSQATLTGYQANVSDFAEQVQARLDELRNGLQALRLKVDRGKAHAALLYLAGDPTL